MTILMNGVDFAIGAIGIPANSLLIVAIIFAKNSQLKGYSLILFNSALTDLLAVIVELIMIADYPALVHIYEGFCTNISNIACRISMVIELHVMFHSILLIAVAFWYRSTVIGGNLPSMISVQAVICAIIVPTLISMSIFTWSDDSLRVIPRVYPGTNMSQIVHSSCNFDDTPMKFVRLWTMGGPIAAYCFIFYFRKQVQIKLRLYGSKMSAKTKEMHDSLNRALYYHSLLPLLSVLGVFGFAAQNLGVQNAMIERTAFLSCSLPPAINPLLTLYFVAPYKRFLSMIASPSTQYQIRRQILAIHLTRDQ